MKLEKGAELLPESSCELSPSIVYTDTLPSFPPNPATPVSYSKEGAGVCLAARRSASGSLMQSQTADDSLLSDRDIEMPLSIAISPVTMSINVNLSSWTQVKMTEFSGEKPYGCHICTKAFTKKNSLTNHLCTHSGEKPYGCHIRTMAFTQNGDLTLHLRTHSGDELFHISPDEH